MQNSKLKTQNHNQIFSSFIATIFSFALYIFNLPTPALAQSTGLSISPPVIEILLAPNKKVIHAFELTNQGESGDFVANLHLVTPIDSEGHVTIDPTPIDPSTIPLVIGLTNADRALGKPFPLNADERTQLVLELEGANTDVSSDTYLALVVSPQFSVLSSQFSVAKPSISALVLVTLTPDSNLPVKLDIVDFDPPLLHDSMTPLTISASLHNSAEIMLRPKGSLEIISPRNHNHQTLDLFPHLVLKQSKRIIQGTNSEDPPSPVPLIWQPSLLNLGPYRLRLNVTTQGGSQIISVEKVVWLLPLRALLITILLAITITTLLLSARKSPPKPSDREE